jgi:hypothetical protein
LLVLLVYAPVMAYGALKSYEVVPCSNYIAVTPRSTPVTQYFRNTVDSLWRVSVWIGDTFAGGVYDIVRIIGTLPVFVSHCSISS